MGDAMHLIVPLLLVAAIVRVLYSSVGKDWRDDLGPRPPLP